MAPPKLILHCNRKGQKMGTSSILQATSSSNKIFKMDGKSRLGKSHASSARSRALEAFRKKYLLVRRIGCGSEATVFACITKRAARALIRSRDANNIDDLQVVKFGYSGWGAGAEIAAHKRLPRSGNILRMRDWDKKDNLWLVTPLMRGGSLFEFRWNCHVDGETIPNSLFWHIFIDLFEGLEKLHASGVANGDIFSSNVFIDPIDNSYEDFPRILIGDFGKSYWVGDPCRSTKESVADMMHCDVWITGAIMYCLRHMLLDVNELHLRTQRQATELTGHYLPVTGLIADNKCTRPLPLTNEENELFEKLIHVCREGERTVEALKDQVVPKARELRERLKKPLPSRIKRAFKRLSAATRNRGMMGGLCVDEIAWAMKNQAKIPDPFDPDETLESSPNPAELNFLNSVPEPETPGRVMPMMNPSRVLPRLGGFQPGLGRIPPPLVMNAKALPIACEAPPKWPIQRAPPSPASDDVPTVLPAPPPSPPPGAQNAFVAPTQGPPVPRLAAPPHATAVGRQPMHMPNAAAPGPTDPTLAPGRAMGQPNGAHPRPTAPVYPAPQVPPWQPNWQPALPNNPNQADLARQAGGPLPPHVGPGQMYDNYHRNHHGPPPQPGTATLQRPRVSPITPVQHPRAPANHYPTNAVAGTFAYPPHPYYANAGTTTYPPHPYHATAGTSTYPPHPAGTSAARLTAPPAANTIINNTNIPSIIPPNATRSEIVTLGQQFAAQAARSYAELRRIMPAPGEGGHTATDGQGERVNEHPPRQQNLNPNPDTLVAPQGNRVVPDAPPRERKRKWDVRGDKDEDDEEVVDDKRSVPLQGDKRRRN